MKKTNHVFSQAGIFEIPKLTESELAKIAAVTAKITGSKTWYGDWDDSKEKGLLAKFKIDESELNGAQILFAAYTYQDYNGNAFVLFLRDGKLYEVHGSHCSCYGLEDQWEPEETTVEAIKTGVASIGYGIRHELTKEILKAIGA